MTTVHARPGRPRAALARRTPRSGLRGGRASERRRTKRRLSCRAHGARLADLFATGTGTRSTCGLSGRSTATSATWSRSPVEGHRIPALSDVVPAAFAEECEIYEQFGIRPAGDKPLNRVPCRRCAGRRSPRLGPRRGAAEGPARTAHVGGQAFEFPFGPVRQVGVESLYYGLVTSGEEIVDLYLFTWHKHRASNGGWAGAPHEALFHSSEPRG